MNRLLIGLLVFVSTLSVSAEKSEYFVESSLPNDAGDFGNKAFHRYGDHKFGYLHLHQTLEGQQFARILLSDGSRNDNQFYGSLVCKNDSGEVIDVLRWNRRLGASIRTMEHNYVFKVTCPGSWGVAWGRVNTNVNYTAMTEALSRVAIVWITGS